jgi:hypothetical protein
MIENDIELKDHDIEASTIKINEEELKKDGYHKISKDAFSQLDFLVQFVPGHVFQKVTERIAEKAIEKTTKNAFRVVLKEGMHLGKSNATSGAFKGMDQSSKVDT